MNVALERTSIRNESTLDRAIRLILAVVFFQLAFFWLGGIGQSMPLFRPNILPITPMPSRATRNSIPTYNRSRR